MVSHGTYNTHKQRQKERKEERQIWRQEVERRQKEGATKRQKKDVQ